ncbi:MAG: hypothetical protein PUP93_28275 [Rhizonema sp. NSF051]|nr:hypothetical protein [Rhizonema sp. NSF051]
MQIPPPPLGEHFFDEGIECNKFCLEVSPSTYFPKVDIYDSTGRQ